MADKLHITIDRLIEIVQNGGAVKTGVDVYNNEGILLLEKNVLITTAKPLTVIKNNGISYVPINPQLSGGIWDKNGREISESAETVTNATPPTKAAPPKLIEKFDAITHIKKEASKKYEKAKENIKQEETLQYLLHAFVKSIGIYPPGSVVHLHNQQLAYVLDSEGPIIIPITDQNKQTLPGKADPINIAALSEDEEGRKINDQKALLSPTDAYSLLPDYLKQPLAA